MARVGGIETITGNLASDPIRRENANDPNRFMTVFTVAENRGYTDRESGQWVEREPVYYSVAVDSADGAMAQNCLDSLKKGQRVSVEGRYSVEPYINQRTGEPGLNHKVWAREVSPSLRYATAEITPNPKRDTGAEFDAEFNQSATMRQDYGVAQEQQVQQQARPGTDFGAGQAGMGGMER